MIVRWVRYENALLFCRVCYNYSISSTYEWNNGFVRNNQEISLDLADFFYTKIDNKTIKQPPFLFHGELNNYSQFKNQVNIPKRLFTDIKMPQKYEQRHYSPSYEVDNVQCPGDSGPIRLRKTPRLLS